MPEPQTSQKVILTGHKPPPGSFTIKTGLTIEEVHRESVTLMYGLSGMGKTTLATQWSPNPLFLMMTGGGEHRPLPLLGKSIPFVEVAGKTSLDMLIAKILGTPDLVLTPGSAPTTAIVVDQLPSYNRLQSGDVLTTVARSRENTETLCQGDFKQIRRRMHLNVNDLTRIPIHKLYLSTMEVDKSFPAGEPLRFAPALSDSLIDDFMSFCDFVFFLTQEDVSKPGSTERTLRRVVYTQPGEKTYAGRPLPFLAKDSSGLLPARIEIPSPSFNLFECIMSYMKTPNLETA